MTPILVNMKCSADDARARVLEWLVTGAFSLADTKDISISAVEPYLVPMIAVTCRWQANWWGEIGEVNQGAYNNALNIYQMAMTHWDGKNLSTEPKKPQESDHLNWYSRGDSVNGEMKWTDIFMGDGSSQNLPEKFGEWCSKISKKIKIESVECSRDAPAWIKSSVAMAQAVPERDPESIFSDLLPNVNDQVYSAVKRDLPKYNRNVNREIQSIEWEINNVVCLPLYLIRYQTPQGNFNCVIDGVTGGLIKGQKARDVGGSIKRAFAKVLSIFGIGKKPTLLLPAPAALLPAPDAPAVTRSGESERAELGKHHTDVVNVSSFISTNKQASQAVAPTRLKALLLWLITGSFGGHRFYLGKGWSGLALAVLTLSFILMMSYLPPVEHKGDFHLGFVPFLILFVWLPIDGLLIIFGRIKDRRGMRVRGWIHPA